MVIKYISIFLLFSFLVLPQLVLAHFHYGLKVETHLHANKQQQLSAVSMTWVYDTEVSRLMLNGKKEINKLRAKLLNDLADFNYYTTLKLNGKSLETSSVSNFQLQKIQQQEDRNLKLSLSLPLKRAQSLKGKNTLEIIHEDPSGSAIIYYKAAADVSIDENLNKLCKVDLKDKLKFEEGEAPQQLKVICSA